MNKFKKITLGLLGAALLTTGLYSCSNDNETTDVQQIEKNALLSRPSSDIIKKYYGTDLQILKTANISDSYGSYILTKYVYPVNNFTDIYSLTDAKGDIEYLIELDKNAERIKSTNILTSEVIFVGDLNKISQLKVAKYDLIDASVSILAEFPVFNGKKFWGWTCKKSEVLDNFTGETSCNLDCVYNALWTKTGKTGSFDCNDENAQSYKISEYQFDTIN